MKFSLFEHIVGIIFAIIGSLICNHYTMENLLTRDLNVNEFKDQVFCNHKHEAYVMTVQNKPLTHLVPIRDSSLDSFCKKDNKQ